jgi:GNAT superfamily N-acetyltransferase
MTEQEFSIVPLAVPRSLDAADAGPFVEMVQLANDVARADTGHADLDEEPRAVLGFWQDTADWSHVGFVAVHDGRVIGAGTLTVATQEGTVTGDHDILVRPEWRGRGIEEALLAAVEDEARGRGLTTLQTWTLHRPTMQGERLVPSTGWGSVPAGDLPARFCARAGFTLEQVERNSGFDLHGSFDAVEGLLADARRAAGSAYRLLDWTGPTPEEHLEGFAYTISRMSTDAPQGGLDIEEQNWDADRVRRRDARLRAQGMTVSVAAVQHVASGAIAAYNELAIGEDHTATTQQYGTLVISEHRGHRLGALVKCANLLRWRELMPGSPRVSTFNAEENRHMLSINEAIGFVPISYAGAWKKVLTRS